MKPGRELDALVAEKVMGDTLPEKMLVTEFYDRRTGEQSIDIPELPHYSTDISAAWEVVEKTGLLKKYDFHQNEKSGLWQIGWGSDGCGFQVEFEGDTAPHAISLAALKAIEK